MCNDKAIKKQMLQLREKADWWVKCVEASGKQCAATDRALQEVIETCDKIKLLYEANF